MALKRAVDAEWETSASKTREADIPQLNDDCIRLLLELALGQRTLATYGADGRVIESRNYYGSPHWMEPDDRPSGSIHTFRQVCRKWERIASLLVRTARVSDNDNPDEILSIPKLFPNATTLNRTYKWNWEPEIDRVCKQLCANQLDTSTIFLPTVNGYRPPHERRIRARDGTIVNHMFIEYIQYNEFRNAAHAYVFQAAWAMIIPSLKSIVLDDSNAVIPIYIDDVTVVTELDLFRAAQHPTNTPWVGLGIADVPEKIRNRVQLHVIIDSDHCREFIHGIQAWFAHPIVVHTVPSFSGYTNSTEEGFPVLFRDGLLYRELWRTRGLAAPLL